MKTFKKDVFRVGDRVVVIEPKIFVRCGYPLGIKDGIEYITQNHAKDIQKLLGKICGYCDVESDKSFPFFYLEMPDPSKIIKELAYLYIKSKNFGGNKRTIYTQLREEFKDKECLIVDKRVVVTGIRYSGGCGEDYDPPYLSGQKSHVLLGLRRLSNDDILNGFGSVFDLETPFIESCYVKKIFDLKSNRTL